MYYNVCMPIELPARLTTISKRARERLAAIDPRRVRMREPRDHPRRTIALAAIAAVVLAGAVALATTGSRPSPDHVPAAGATAPSATDPPAATIPAPITGKGSRTSDEAASAPTSAPERDPRFFDPYYVFTEVPVEQVDAYPLADPPGIVINLLGAPEPTRPAAELVGDDPRIRAIRRRSTPQGQRYILRVTSPIRRIDVTHEGNVVIIAPTR